MVTKGCRLDIPEIQCEVKVEAFDKDMIDFCLVPIEPEDPGHERLKRSRSHSFRPPQTSRIQKSGRKLDFELDFASPLISPDPALQTPPV